MMILMLIYYNVWFYACGISEILYIDVFVCFTVIADLCLFVQYCFE